MTINIITTTAVLSIINQLHTHSIISITEDTDTNNNRYNKKSSSNRCMYTIGSMLSVFGISMFFMSRYK